MQPHCTHRPPNPALLLSNAGDSEAAGPLALARRDICCAFAAERHFVMRTGVRVDADRRPMAWRETLKGRTCDAESALSLRTNPGHIVWRGN